jgi:hypothetical protein
VIKKDNISYLLENFSCDLNFVDFPIEKSDLQQILGKPTDDEFDFIFNLLNIAHRGLEQYKENMYIFEHSQEQYYFSLGKGFYSVIMLQKDEANGAWHVIEFACDS